LAALRAITAPYARVEEPQKVVNFGGRSHCGSRIPRSVLLANGDGRRDAGNFIYIRLFHAFQELPRVRRERFHIAPLAFGVHRIEHQRRFTGAGHTGHHGKLIVRKRERDIFQIVDARSTDEYGFFQGVASGKRGPVRRLP